MAELKPCPFCGGELKRHGNKRLGYYYSHPDNDCLLAEIDDANGVAIILECDIEKWNRRCESEEQIFTRQFIHEHGLEFALASAWNGRKEKNK